MKGGRREGAQHAGDDSFSSSFQLANELVARAEGQVGTAARDALKRAIRLHEMSLAEPRRTHSALRRSEVHLHLSFAARILIPQVEGRERRRLLHQAVGLLT